jgi:L-iditol 2-dehydrogenase
VRAAVLRSPGIMEVEEIPDPIAPEGGALLKVKACSICGTDLKILSTGHRDLAYPRVLGHEIVGRVLEAPENATIQEEDTIQVWPGIACGGCRPCLRGHDNQCKDMSILGFNRDGGFEEMMALPRESITKGLNILPKGANSSEATLAEPLGCCINAQDLAGVSRDDFVLIIGGGPTGILHALLARQRGAEKIILSEKLEARRKLAERAADRVVNASSEDLSSIVAEETGGEGVDAIMLATPEVEADNFLLRLLAPGGRICAFSGPKPGGWIKPMDIRSIHYRDLTLVGAYGCPSSCNRRATEMISSGALDVSWLLTFRTSLERIKEAFDHAAGRREMRSVIDRF